MECYYHPERESTDICAICGKSICKECGLEIAGKIYCKECLEKIVGLGIDNSPRQPERAVAPEPVRLNKQPIEDNVYQPQTEQVAYTPQEEIQPVHEIKQISDDSPYNIKDNVGYAQRPESPYAQQPQAPSQIEREMPPKLEPQITPETINEPADYIYPDHSYEPQTTSARLDLEDKYERYLDDLYFDEKDVPLGEQLAKDEEEYGSLTRRPYAPRNEPAQETRLKQRNKKETPEEMEARIRAEILAEKEGIKPSEKSIHNLKKYKDDKEPMNTVDIILTVILIIVILIVIYYIIYVFILNAYYPTFMDAIYGLTNPQNVINNILTPQQ